MIPAKKRKCLSENPTLKTEGGSGFALLLPFSLTLLKYQESESVAQQNKHNVLHSTAGVRERERVIYGSEKQRRKKERKQNPERDEP